MLRQRHHPQGFIRGRARNYIGVDSWRQIFCLFQDDVGDAAKTVGNKGTDESFCEPVVEGGEENVPENPNILCY